jgi:hypothetical protein
MKDEDLKPRKHECKEMVECVKIYEEYGVAINSIEIRDHPKIESEEGVHVETSARWMANNGEYATAVNFCPFCGIKLTA